MLGNLIKGNKGMGIIPKKKYFFSQNSSKEKYEKICQAEIERQKGIKKKNRIENQSIDSRLLQGLAGIGAIVFMYTLYRGFSYTVTPLTQSEKRKKES